VVEDVLSVINISVVLLGSLESYVMNRGLIGPDHAQYPNISVVQRESLYLPGFVGEFLTALVADVTTCLDRPLRVGHFTQSIMNSMATLERTRRVKQIIVAPTILVYTQNGRPYPGLHSPLQKLLILSGQT
jgi:hypothetical protein